MKIKYLFKYIIKLANDVWSAVAGTNYYGFCAESLHTDMYPVDYDLHLKNKFFEPQDNNGIPIANYAFAYNQYNPTRVAAYGLAHFNRYRKYGEEKNRNTFLIVADWFANQKNGLFEYAFSVENLTPPWISGMAQGQGISVLVRAYTLTQKQVYLDAALLAAEPFTKNISDGGVRYKLDDECDILEEFPIPQPVHVLNGFLYAVIGILDLSKIDNQILTTLNFERIENAVKKIDLWEVTGWSTYDLHNIHTNMRNYATVTYHKMHVAQLRYLSTQLQNKKLEQTAAEWALYYEKLPNRLKALWNKIFYRTKYKTSLPRESAKK